MSISDLYSSGQHKRDIGHFASIVKLTKSHEGISENEQALLDKYAKRLGIENEEYKSILKNPEKYPINPPTNYDERIERLYRLANMVVVDKDIAKEEVALMKKLAVGLHFDTNNVEVVCLKAMELVVDNVELDDFVAEIKKVNKAS